MRQIYLLLFGLLCGMPIFGQVDTTERPAIHSFTVGANLWTRGEWRDGALPDENGSDEAVFIMESTLLRFSYQYKGLEVRVAPKHAGVWGAQGGGAFSLDEGWFALRGRNGLFLQMGRQKLAYDDERIIGNNDWAMVASRHDVLRTGIEDERHKLHLLFAFNQNDANTDGGTYYVDGGQPYKSMQTIWYHFSPNPQLGASLLFMNTGMQDMVEKGDKSQYQQLLGAFVDWRPGPLSFQASYYRQSGYNEYQLPISAWMMSAEAAWRISRKWNLNTGYYHMSGDDLYYVPMEGSFGMARKTRICGFNPIFGSHHQFYGAMDFFYVEAYYGGNTPGLQDLHLGVQWNPTAALDLEAAFHYLATSVVVEDLSRTLGHELELSASWQLSRDVKLQAGYSFMKGTETMVRLKRTSDKNHLQWGWLMLSVTPEFFSFVK